MVRYLLLVFLFMMSVVLHAQNLIRLKTVVIDAGHGGKDPGAIGTKVREKDVTLSVALKLGNYINENFPDVKVVYTRNKDVFVPLDERAIIANKNKADLFISIHANWVGKPTVLGTETFVLGLHRSQDNLEVAKKENSVIVLEENYNTKYEGFDPNSVESYIIFELMQNAYLDQSIHFASLIENQFAQRAGRVSRGVKQAGFLVLRQTAMPSVLVECGYLTNKNEEAFLGSEEGQALLASAIFRAFKDYKNEYDAKSNLGVTSSPNTADVKSKPVVTANASKTSNNQTAIKSSSVVFRVQIATNPQPLPAKTGVLSNFDNTWMYKDKGVFKYTVGETSNYIEIKKVLLQAKKSVADAFIVAFENNQRISIDEALQKLGQTRQSN